MDDTVIAIHVKYVGTLYFYIGDTLSIGILYIYI